MRRHVSCRFALVRLKRGTAITNHRYPAMCSLYDIIFMVLNLIWWIVLIHIIMSWLINFQVLNLGQPLVAQIWYGLNRLLEPIYGRLRRLLPDMGGIDLSPIILILGLYAVQIIMSNNKGFFC